MSLRGLRLINMLKKKDILPEWKGKLCPRCGVGKMGPLKYNTANKTWTHRCNHYKCHKNLQPHDFHPIFYMGAGNSHSPLHVQASILLCATAGVKEVSTHLILDTSKKPVETIYKNLETARSRYVNAKEKDITYGDWHDVEVDEVDVGKFVDPSIQDAKNTTWEQWGGMVERGNPSSLRLFRLNPKKTKQSAPGPGPIRKCDWVPVAKKYLKNMNVVLHSNGARAYTMKFPGIIHCNVVHKKKRKIAVWVRPHFTKNYTITIPGKGKTVVKSGTQVIDRFWGFLRKIRSAQFEYWHRHQNMWEVTGKMLRFLHDSR
ncbi:unnamed protein product [Symbiodinium natans]|uniref:Uncharacterized protein n=1 Tax=Symbiodinium natans TaxID=878477 RepID=A0A812I9Q8_9DINO|nr:unnamed protein product [Symbiodinium natans]